MSSHFVPQTAINRGLGMGLSGVSADALKSWYQGYAACDGRRLDHRRTVIHSVESDVLNYEEIEAQVQQLMPMAGVVDGFCAKCQHLLEHWPAVFPYVLGHILDGIVGKEFHVIELKAAARQGCRFCALILSEMEKKDVLDTFLKIEVRLRAIGDSGTASLSIRYPAVSSLYSQSLRINFPRTEALDQRQGAPEAVSLISDILPPSTKLWRHPGNDPFDIARMWLARCSGSHERCSGQWQYRPPSRLISIDHGAVKLVVTASLLTPPRYATLSYCWGSEPFTTLTRDNLDLFLDHIPVNELPQTLIDAIDACRRLEIDYIWIDALCIIQKEENNSDWYNEAGSMSSIYGGTFVTLAASDATNAHEGFLQGPMQKHHGSGFVARVTTTDYCRLQNFFGGATYSRSITRTHLATRAWTLQERHLSPRTIYFGNTGFFWVCRSQICSEFSPDGYGHPIGAGCSVAEDTPLKWGRIVEQYSRAELTYGSDRLPALSGIATRQHQVTHDQYLAGMWRKSLVTQLMWQRIRERRPRPEWRAPTWSWTSIDGEVTCHDDFNNQNALEYVKVLNAWTTPSGKDLYGAVADGELTVSCTKLVRCHINTDGNVVVQVDGLGRIESGPQKLFRVRIDCRGEVSAHSDSVLYLLPANDADGKWIRTTYQNEPLVARLFHEGLILRVSSESNKNDPKHFQRVGSFQFLSSKSCVNKRDKHLAFMEFLRKEGSSITTTELTQTVPASVNQDGRLVIVIK